MIAVEYIEHKGLVSAIENGKLKISLLDKREGCTSCKLKSACGIGEDSTAYVFIDCGEHVPEVGKEVVLRMTTQVGFLATFYGYLLPFLLVISILLVGVAVGQDELVSGLIALGVLVPYYAGLSLMNKKLQRKLQMEIIEK